MKILITILLALFISNSANADNFKSIKDVCEDVERLIIQYKNSEYDASINEEARILSAKYWKENAKLYHYLDCSDFR